MLGIIGSDVVVLYAVSYKISCTLASEICHAGVVTIYAKVCALDYMEVLATCSPTTIAIIEVLVVPSSSALDTTKTKT